MGVLTNSVEKRATLENPSTSLAEALGAMSPVDGVSVNEQTALRLSHVYAAINILSNSIASIPLDLYRKSDGQKIKDTDHPVYDLIHAHPNDEQTSYLFRHVLQGHVSRYGNGFCYVVRQGDVPQELMILHPKKVQLKRQQGRLFYKYQDISDLLPAQDVIHIRAFSNDGMVGLSLIEVVAKEVLGLGLAAQKFATKWFENSGSHGAVLEHPGNLSEDAITQLRNQLQRDYAGLGHAHKFKIFEEGMTLKEIGGNPEDSQLLETRQFSVADASRIWNIPLHKLADLSKATLNNVEQMSISFVRDSIRPWLVNWEQELEKKLLTKNERREYFIRFNIEGLLRGDSQARAEFYKTMWEMGAYSINEIRDKEDDNPVENGDTRFVPLNFAPLGTPQERSEQRTEARSSDMRLKLINAWQSVFEKDIQRAVDIEVNDTRKAAVKHLERRDQQSFYQFLEDYYQDSGEFDSKLRSAVAGTFTTYALEQAKEAGLEVDSEWDQADRDQFVQAYIDTFALRYRESSRAQLESVAAEAISDGVAAVEAVNQRLDEWQGEASVPKAAKQADQETRQLGNSVARMVFASAGFRLLWDSETGGDTCPSCTSLHGVTVGRQDPFIPKGQTLQTNTEQNPFPAKTNIYHAPLHRGCNCTVRPST